MLHYRLSFLQCDWRRDISLQKVINVNEARGISRMSPDPLSTNVEEERVSEEGEEVKL